jgi:hypothetical protein
MLAKLNYVRKFRDLRLSLDGVVVAGIEHPTPATVVTLFAPFAGPSHPRYEFVTSDRGQFVC